MASRRRQPQGQPAASGGRPRPQAHRLSASTSSCCISRSSVCKQQRVQAGSPRQLCVKSFGPPRTAPADAPIACLNPGGCRTPNQDRSFTFILKTPPAAILLKKAAGGRPNAPAAPERVCRAVSPPASPGAPARTLSSCRSLNPQTGGCDRPHRAPQASRAAAASPTRRRSAR
jgi:hypothetical protein